MFKKILLPLLLALSFNAYSLTFPTIITVTGISSTNSLPAAQSNRVAIQSAVDSCTDPLGCTVRIIDKDAFIDACVSARGVAVPNNVRVSVERSYLKVYPNNCSKYEMFRFWGKHDSELRLGGTSALIGDKLTHVNADIPSDCAATDTDECGHLISITDSQNIVVSDGTATLANGDGIYIGGDNSLGNNITVNYMKLNNNRRQGISVISGSNITIEKNWLVNTGQSGFYAPPGLGLDAEVNGCPQRVINLKVVNNYFGNNIGGGFKAYSPVCPNDRTITTDDVYQNMIVSDNIFNENVAPLSFSNAMNIIAEHNTIKSANNDFFYFAGAADIIVRRNTVRKTGALGGYLVGVDQSRVSVGNLVQDNVYFNIANPVWPSNTPASVVTFDGNLYSD